jgi:hypothetical protein
MNWRLIVNVLALVTEDSKVFLIPTEKVSYKTSVGKLIKTSYTEVKLVEEKFKLKINESLKVLLKSPNLGDTWLEVGNFDDTQLGTLLVNSPNNNGEFVEDFEVSVSTEQPSLLVRFESPSLPNYKKSVDEMIRRLNCEIYKKTKKFVPGHRYDTTKETIYILGTVPSKVSENKYNLINKDVFLYVNNLKDSEKSISDVMKNRVLGESDDDIKISYSFSNMVDSGEVLKNDFTGNYYDYFSDLLNNSINSDNFEGVMNTLILGDTYNISDVNLKNIEKYLHEKIFNIAVSLKENTFSYGCSRINLNSIACMTNVTDDIKLNLSYLIIKNTINITNINDKNLSDIIKTRLQIINAYNINLSDICVEEVVRWTKIRSNIFKRKNFDEYLKYYESMSRSRINVGTIYSINALDYSYDGCEFITLLKNRAVKIMTEETDPHMIKTNVGTRKSPRYSYKFTINLDDLVKEEVLTKTIKDSIIDNQFVEVEFNCFNSK